ncbi:uncharacterized protein LOC144103348 [Amblyomma americanum]
MAVIWTTVSLLALLLVKPASQASLTGVCSCVAARTCYAELFAATKIEWKPCQGGDWNQTFAAACAKLTPQSECYHQFTACPEDLKANLSSFEDGYTLRRDLICDANAVQVYQKIDACLRQDRHFLEECIMTHTRNAGEFSEHQICRVFYISTWCARNTIAKSCPAESDAAIAFLIQASASFLLLHGCL